MKPGQTIPRSSLAFPSGLISLMRYGGRDRFSRTLVAAGLGLMIGCMPFAAKANTGYSDSFNFSTTGQSQFGPGSAPSASFNGTISQTWGTYRNNNPVSYGVNGVTGSQNAIIIPATPGTPDIHVPGIPGVQIGSFCVPFFGCTPSFSTAIPGFTIPGIPGTPAVRGDTRTGSAITVASSGEVGVGINTKVTAGNVSAVVPVNVNLDIKGNVGQGIFSVKANSVVQPGATLTATAPTVNFGVNSVVNLNNSISATGCIIGAGCSSSSSSINLNPGNFNFITLDTATSKGLSIAGIDIPVTTSSGSYTVSTNKGVCAVGTACSQIPVSVSGPALATVSYALPQTITSGPATGNTVSVVRKDAVINGSANLTGIVQSVLGAPLDILNPKISVKVPGIPVAIGSVAGTTFKAQTGVSVGLNQSLSMAFDPNSVIVTLNFENPVYKAQSANSAITCEPPPSNRCMPAIPSQFTLLGNTVSFGVGEEEFLFGGGNLISRTYSLRENASQFSSQTGLDFGFNMPLQAGCYAVSVPGFNTEKCGFNQTVNFFDPSISLFSNTFNLGGFNTASFLTPFISDTPIGGGSPVQGEVPEPSSILLAAIALLGMGMVMNRRKDQMQS